MRVRNRPHSFRIDPRPPLASGSLEVYPIDSSGSEDTLSMMDLLLWLEESGLSTWLRESQSIMAFPFVLALHTLGLGLVVGRSEERRVGKECRSRRCPYN